MVPKSIRAFYEDESLVGAWPVSEESVQTVNHQQGNLRAQLQIKRQVERIQDVRYQVKGCPYTIACVAHAAQQLLQQQQVSVAALVEALQLPKTKYHCALFVEDLLKRL